jgi:hypothetical protein
MPEGVVATLIDVLSTGAAALRGASLSGAVQRGRLGSVPLSVAADWSDGTPIGELPIEGRPNGGRQVEDGRQWKAAEALRRSGPRRLPRTVAVA